MTSLPTLIAGPLLRHTDQSQLTVWLVTSHPVQARLHVQILDGDALSLEQHWHQVPIGQRCFIQLLQLQGELPRDTPLTYQVYEVKRRYCRMRKGCFTPDKALRL